MQAETIVTTSRHLNYKRIVTHDPREVAKLGRILGKLSHYRGLRRFELVIAPDFTPVSGLHGIFIAGNTVRAIVLPVGRCLANAETENLQDRRRNDRDRDNGFSGCRSVVRRVFSTDPVDKVVVNLFNWFASSGAVICLSNCLKSRHIINFY